MLFRSRMDSFVEESISAIRRRVGKGKVLCALSGVEVPEDQVVFHMMGQGQETRHIIMQNEQAVISPSWSIHAGAGTASYTFIWAMGGENQAFDDMDVIPTTRLK